jgi:hypothetical protein
LSNWNNKYLQDEALLTDWKQQLDRDVETLKAKSNLGSIRTVSRGKTHYACFFLLGLHKPTLYAYLVLKLL